MPVFSEINVTSSIPLAGTKLALEPVQLDGPRALFAGVVLPGGTAATTPTPPVLEPTAIVSLRKPSKTSRASKFQLTIIIPQPVLDLEGNPTKVKDREARIDVTLTTSERAVPAEREQILQFMQEMLYSGFMKEVAVDNKTIY